MRNFIGLSSLAIMMISLSCSFFKKENSNVEVKEQRLYNEYYDPLTPSDIFLLIDFVIDIIDSSFIPISNIYPCFSDTAFVEVLDLTLNSDSLNLNYSYEELKELQNDFEMLNGDSIIDFITNKDKRLRINEDIYETGMMIELSPPMVNRKRRQVFFKILLFFKDENKVLYLNEFYVFNLIKTDTDDEVWSFSNKLPVKGSELELISLDR